MNTIYMPEFYPGAFSRRARLRMEHDEPVPLFLANWSNAIFVHYETDPAALQSCVPFQLDLHEGKAYVSLVAFTLDHMRPGIADGRLGEWLMRPIAPCQFLNVRTYVKNGRETGIYFLAEWLSCPLAIPLGPVMFGLPYRFGTFNYNRKLSAEVCSRKHGRLAFSATRDRTADFGPSSSGSLDEFLLERYAAFTEWEGIKRFFRVWHEPWRQIPLSMRMEEESLLFSTGQWMHHATCIGGNYSTGVTNVQMGRPRLVR